MVLPAIKEQILSDLGRLSPDLQRRALELVQGLATQAPKGASIDDFLELAGTLDERSAREMKDAISSMRTLDAL